MYDVASGIDWYDDRHLLQEEDVCILFRYKVCLRFRLRLRCNAVDIKSFNSVNVRHYANSFRPYDSQSGFFPFSPLTVFCRFGLDALPLWSPPLPVDHSLSIMFPSPVLPSHSFSS
jgi:hypothetical protein